MQVLLPRGALQCQRFSVAGAGESWSSLRCKRLRPQECRFGHGHVRQRDAKSQLGCRGRQLAAAATSWRADFALDPYVTREQLSDPAHIGGTAQASANVQDRHGDTGLDAYMRLPVEHYFELDPALIKPLGGNAFALKVPRVSLFNVWVEPLVHVTVRLLEGSSAADSAVVIEATNWSLRGSDLIESLGLKRRFSLAFTAQLTWTPAPATGSSQNGSGAQSGHPPAPGTGRVHGDLRLDVWSEVIGPFRFMPRAVLEGTGNAVLGALVRGLLPPFVGRLAADYEKWATSPEYRARRLSTAHLQQ